MHDVNHGAIPWCFTGGLQPISGPASQFTMNDQAETSPKYSDLREELNRQVMAAIDKALDAPEVGGAMQNVERFVYRAGYDSGFNAGWDAAVRRFAAVLDTSRPPQGPTQANIDPNLTMTAPRKAEPDDPTIKDLVLASIKRRPGIRGIEIVSTLKATGLDANERSVRTSLHRLKLAKKIRIDDGRWYPAEPSDT